MLEFCKKIEEKKWNFVLSMSLSRVILFISCMYICLEDEDWRVLFSYQQDSDITGHILYKCVYTSLQRSVKLKFNNVLCRYPDVPSKYMP